MSLQNWSVLDYKTFLGSFSQTDVNVITSSQSRKTWKFQLSPAINLAAQMYLTSVWWWPVLKERTIDLGSFVMGENSQNSILSLDCIHAYTTVFTSIPLYHMYTTVSTSIPLYPHVYHCIMSIPLYHICTTVSHIYHCITSIPLYPHLYWCIHVIV